MKYQIVDSHQDLYCALHDDSHYIFQTNLKDIKDTLSIVHASIFIEPPVYDQTNIRGWRDETFKQLKFYRMLINNDSTLKLILSKSTSQKYFFKNLGGLFILSYKPHPFSFFDFLPSAAGVGLTTAVTGFSFSDVK